MDDHVLKIGSTYDHAKFMPEGLSFPANKDQIMDHARKSHMPPDVIEQLNRIPDRKYESISDLVATAAK